MTTKIFRIVACGAPELYKTASGGQTQKRQLRLQEFGGYNSNDNQAQRISNCIVCTMFGNLSQCEFHLNDLELQAFASLPANIRVNALTEELKKCVRNVTTIVDFI